MRLFFTISILLGFGLAPSITTATPILVYDVPELLEHIQSNTHILLAPGIYNLTAEVGYSTETIDWEDVFDGMQPVVKNVNNLTIEGMPGAEIIIEPRYAWVFRFVNCANLTIKSLTLGHTDAGSCVGGVLSFAYSAKIKIDNCMLYGSGTEGIAVDNCNNVSFSYSGIYECTYDLMTLSNSSNLVFSNSSFYRTGEFDLVTVSACDAVVFKSCAFADNLTGEYLPHFFMIDAESEEVLVSDCVFMRNQVGKFVNDESRIRLSNNQFIQNSFD